jgi:hypothetical protein
VHLFRIISAENLETQAVRLRKTNTRPLPRRSVDSPRGVEFPAMPLLVFYQQIQSLSRLAASSVMSALGTLWNRVRLIALMHVELTWRDCIAIIPIGSAALYIVFYPVPPGWAVALLGLVAVFMAAKNMSPIEKGAWFLISTMLFVAEIRAITKDRRDSNDSEYYARQMERAQFSAVLRQEQQTFEKTTSLGESISALSTVRQEYRANQSSPPDLKTRALRLSLNILEFLTDRQRHDPQLNPSRGHGGFVIFPGGGATDNASQYVKLTRALFADKFEGEIHSVRDGLASKGLRDSTLDGVTNSTISAWSGDSDFFIREIADTIRKLAILVVPDDVYRNLSNAQLGDIAIKEADQLESMVSKTIDQMASSVPHGDNDTLRFWFYGDFRTCCLDDVKNIRGAIINRIGPQSMNHNEMDAFIRAMSEQTSTNELSDVDRYVPELRTLGETVKKLP